ncbi:superoxide dismutase [Mucilaginibacter hurinus]|uniref:Superoxide dismutase n=1 Tax=Mucilaginibacter hurinus TaxID=2201324 RepID=A0A367GPH6_9SPHI|nr:superoxide dismutase [Mucilaginibacter hurinus]RCH55392.1 superoxide dismutase [Mucilaginibacter hurinus]
MESNSRRKFIQHTLAATAAIGISNSFITNTLAGDVTPVSAAEPLKFKQIDLPFKYKALEPYIDGQTNEIHYTKHHAAYVKTVNEAIIAEKIPYNTVEDFFANTSKLSAKARNNGGGAWNHNFFWSSMRAPGMPVQPGKLMDAIDASFGSLDKFKAAFGEAASKRFGSGWAWLVKDGNKLKVGSTPNQDNPLMDNAEIKGTPILALDVWEHAYYLKYQNKRADYIENWWNVVNWDAAAERMR